MEAKELMIGDWVYDNYHKAYGTVNTLTRALLWVGEEDNDWQLKYDEVEPIPLTEEILNRHFPDPDEITWFPLDEQPGVFNIYWEHPTFGEGEARLNLRYVHELQHLLRMIKCDKEVRP